MKILSERSRKRAFLGSATVAVLATTAALFGSASAQASGDTTAEAAVSSTNISAESAQRAQNYWTPERMRAALPGEKLIQNNSRVALGNEKVASGLPKTVPGTSPQLRSDTNPNATGPLTPISKVGKVFFTAEDGRNYVCSGTSVAASNRSTVSTAGHCLNQGPGVYFTNFVFVPAYENGNAPYGRWAATRLYAPSQWVNNGDINYDTGFAVVNTLNGKRLGDVVGTSGVAFNQQRGLQYTAYGYPAASPYDGQRLWSCSGTARNDQVNRSNTTQGIPCTMTGGSSGGPWFIGSGSSGAQNSVNSYGYQGMQVMYGPYWGNVIRSTYDRAAA